MAKLTQWLPEIFDAEAVAKMPEGVSVDFLLPDEGQEALDSWADAYALAVSNDDAEGIQALRAMLEEGLDTVATRQSDGIPDWARPIFDESNPVGGDEIDSDEDGEPLWPDEDAESVTEGKRKKSTFSGERRDSLGRRRCYSNGRQIKCDPLPDDPAPASPPDPARPWDRPDWERVPSKGTRPKWVNAEGETRYGARPLERAESQKLAEYESRQKRLSEPPRFQIDRDPAAADRQRAASRMIVGGEPDSLAGMIGIPNGAVMTAFAPGNDSRTINVGISHPDVNSWSRTIRANADGTASVSNNSFFLRRSAQGKGFGAKAFAEQVRGCFAAGVREITTTAGKGGAGAERMNGYYTWATLGYDAELESRYRYRLPESLKGARTVQDLMETDEGRAHWKATGYMESMKFDLTPGSRSLRRLNKYLAQKGKGASPIPHEDPEVIARRDQAIAERRARVAAFVPPPPPPPPAPEQRQTSEDRVRQIRAERYHRLTSGVAQRFQASLDPETRQDLARRVAADPDYADAVVLARYDSDGPQAAERAIQDVWLRQSRRLADDYLEEALAQPDPTARLVFEATVREAEKVMRESGSEAAWDPLVWRQVALNRYSLSYGSSSSGVLAALRMSWNSLTHPSLRTTNMPRYLWADPSIAADAIRGLRQQAGQ